MNREDINNKNLPYKSAIVYYQNNKPILIKEGDYIELELINGRIVKDTVYSIDTWECGVIYVNEISKENSFDVEQVKRIIMVIDQSNEGVLED